jgi:DNA-binding transcriptional LysR family regulator
MDAHLRDLRYFVAVAEHLSFTRAAAELHLSQPALSKQIRGLEGTLRVRLFDRDRRQVRLTDAGEALLTSARKILADWDEGTAAVTEAAARELSTLRIGTLTAIGHQLYSSAVTHFSRRLPGWRIELRSIRWDDPTGGLRDRATDVAFLWLPVDDGGIDHEIIVRERRFVVLNSRHHLAGRQSVDFSELADEPFIALPPSAGPLRDFWLGADHDSHPKVRVVADVSTAEEKYEIISSGAAVGLVAEANAIVYARPGITAIPVTDLAPASLAIAWRSDNRTPAVESFVGACLDAAHDLTLAKS